MKKFLAGKTAILLLGGLCVLVIFYMVASLGKLQLNPAKPFSYIQQTAPISSGSPPAWNGLFVFGFLFLALLIVLIILLPPDQRKKFLLTLAWLVLAGFITYLVLTRLDLSKPFQPPQLTPNEEVITLLPGPTHTPAILITPSVFVAPHLSLWTSYLVALAILLFIAGFWGWLVVRRRRIGAPYEAIAEIARSALDEIEEGRDWGDAILNSYYRMNTAVAEWRGIHRAESMTPAEFASELVSTHLPENAVFRLTTLFERVRYGDKRSTSNDIQVAVGCLTDILDYCRRAK
jgi:hypothetical protein